MGWWEGTFRIQKSLPASPASNLFSNGIMKLNFFPAKGKNINGKLFAAAFDVSDGKIKSVETEVTLTEGKSQGLLLLKKKGNKNGKYADEALTDILLKELKVVTFFKGDVIDALQIVGNADDKDFATTFIYGNLNSANSSSTAFKKAESCAMSKVKTMNEEAEKLKQQFSGDELQEKLYEMAYRYNQKCAIAEILDKSVQNVYTDERVSLIKIEGVLPFRLDWEEKDSKWIKGRDISFSLSKPELMFWKENESLALLKSAIVLTDKKTGEKRTVNYPQVNQSAITTSGIAIDFPSINTFHDGYAVVRKGDRYGMIDPAGNEFIPLGKYNLNMGKETSGTGNDAYISGFFNGVSVVRDVETEKYGYIDLTGKLIVPCTLQQAEPFQPDGYGHGSVSDFEKRLFFDYFFDKKGRRYLVKNLSGSLFPSPFVITQSPDGQKTIVTKKNGTRAFETTYSLVRYGDGLFEVYQRGDQLMKRGFIDTTGKLIIPFRFAETKAGWTVESFSEGLALHRPKFTDEYEYSYINKKGEEVIFLKKELGIDRIYNFENGYARTTLKNRQRELIDKKGTIIVLEDLFLKANLGILTNLTSLTKENFKFQYSTHTDKGVFFYLQLGLNLNAPNTGLFSNGKKTPEITGGVGGGNPRYYFATKGYGMMDYQGNILIPPVFDFIGAFDPVSGLAKASYIKNDKETQGFINGQGQFVLTLKNNIKGFTNN